MQLEHLKLQSEAFKESFNILSKAKNHEELARKFFHILRDNLLIVNIIVYFRANDKETWKKLFSRTKSTDISIKDLLKDEEKTGIFHIKHHEFKICIKHPFFDKSIIVVFLGAKLDDSEYSESDKIALQFFLQQLDIVYRLLISRKKENQLVFELNHRVLQLTSLVDLGIEVARLQAGNQLLNNALEKVFTLTNSSKGVLRVKKGRKIVDEVFYPFPFRLKDVKHTKFHISTSFSFMDKKYNFHLYEKESRTGLTDFDNNDQLLLDAFARQVHVSLENQNLHEQSLEKELIDKEISLAGSIQKNLIPEKLPDINGYDQFGINIPTKFIGGDYYDCIPLKDGRFMFIMADVSGKGVAAGLLVSTLHASVHAYLNGPFHLKELVHNLNKVVCDAAKDERFITAVFAVLDPKSNELMTVSAGHNPTFLLRNNQVIEELWGGIPLGMMPTPLSNQISKSHLKKGESVLFYTDGLTEALNRKEEQYDDIRPLKNFLISHKAKSAQSFVEDLLADLHDFTGDTEQHDDITALYLMRKNL